MSANAVRTRVTQTKKRQPAAIGRKAPGGRARKGSLPTASLDRDRQFHLKKLELLRAAVRVFNQRGATNTSLEDVAKELGITKAALYYYFESKQDILLACYT